MQVTQTDLQTGVIKSDFQLRKEQSFRKFLGIVAGLFVIRWDLILKDCRCTRKSTVKGEE